MRTWASLKGKQIKAPFWPEPVRVLDVHPVGDRFEIAVKLLKSGRLSEQVLTKNELEELLNSLKGSKPFSGNPHLFALGVEAHRIQLGYAFDPYFAVWASRVDPLPHQLEAVYGVLLKRPKVRFLLADDPGAGKTIMAGLFLKELKYRGQIQRVLIVTPANLTDQWRRELKEKFNETFVVANRETVNARFGESFWEKENQVITSLDFAKREPYIEELRSVRWDLVIVDEAHKLSATRYGKGIKRSQRYRLGEVLSETATHLLFLTATPHQGDAERFRLLLDLLEPYLFATTGILEEAARAGENPILLRRLKEDMTDFEGKPLFPPRHVHTSSFRLSPSEKRLYEDVTDYVRYYFNRALEEKKRNVGLAMTVLQRRLASSTYAIAASLENRLKRLQKLSEDAAEFRTATEQEEEIPEEPEDLLEEERWQLEDHSLKFTLARNYAELRAEIEKLEELAKRARILAKLEDDTKLKELLKVLEKIGNEKLLVFTEHRDTLHFLVNALRRRGYRVTYIEGGMRLEERIEREREFRDAAQVMVATEAAGEGINLQFCSVMVNYDLPWNPTRLEQRMGRIHRYGQKYEVHIYNLVAEGTREGDVLRMLLAKLEAMRQALGSDRVYDVVGELLADVDLERLILEHIAGRKDLKTIQAAVEARLDPARLDYLKEITLEALAEREINLSRLREDLKRSEANRLEPEYTQRFFARAVEELGGKLEPRRDGTFGLTLPYELVKERNLSRHWKRVTFDPKAKFDAELLAPGHPVFDAVLEAIIEKARPELLKGATFSSPHVAAPGPLAYFQLGVKNSLGQTVSRRPVAVLKDGNLPRRLPPNVLVDARPAEVPNDNLPEPTTAAEPLRSWIYDTLLETYLHEVEAEQRRILDIKRKYGEKSLQHLINESSKRLAKLKLRARKGEDVILAIRNEEQRLKELTERLEAFTTEIEQASRLSPEVAELLGVAWLVPEKDARVDEDDPQIRRQVEVAAMQAVLAYERQAGRNPIDVSQENLGYDIESSGRFIEVKGKASTGPVALTLNEWIAAHRLGDDYFLYIVTHALDRPSLHIIQNPAAKLRPGEEVGVVRFVVPEKSWREAAGASRE